MLEERFEWPLACLTGLIVAPLLTQLERDQLACFRFPKDTRIECRFLGATEPWRWGICLEFHPQHALMCHPSGAAI